MKKILSILLVAVMLASLVAMSVSAGATVVNGIKMTGSVSDAPGATGALTLTFKVNGGVTLNTLVLNIGYNAKTLSLKSVTNGDVFNEANGGSMFDYNAAKNPLVLYFESNGITNITAADKTKIVTVKFDIIDDKGNFDITASVDKNNTIYANGTTPVTADVTFVQDNFQNTQHNYLGLPTTHPATCTEAGYTEKTCNTCGAVLDHVEIEAPLGHKKPAEGVVTVPATITQKGSVTYTCTECLQVVVEEISLTLKPGWNKDANGWFYVNSDLTVAVNKWIKDSSGWCHVGANGYMEYNKWIKDSKGWCYCGKTGYMEYNKWIKDSKGWCHVGSTGYMEYNKWIKDSKGWCHVGTSGYMEYNKWIKDSKGWCHVGKTGYMEYNKWIKDSKGWCYCDGSGYMVYNKWIKDSKGWCYVGKDGYQVFNTKVGQYTIGKDGYMI